MRVIGSAAGIDIIAADEAYISYFNSPYIGHSRGAAVDIYPAHQEWGGEVPSPISGKVIRVRRLRMGAEKAFPTADFDFGLAIKSEVSDTDIVRVMHCQPTVKEGDQVAVGDALGSLIRSRYFNYWTGPHYHVEIMPLASFPRSSQSYSLKTDLDRIPKHFGVMPPSIEILVSDVSRDRAIGYPRKKVHARVGHLYGLAIQGADNGSGGILDAGVPHYNHGGVLGRSNLRLKHTVQFGGIPIGVVTRAQAGAKLFEMSSKFKVSISGVSALGLSCYLYPSSYVKKGTPPIVLIPQKYGSFLSLLEQDSTAILNFKAYSNMDKT